LAGFLPFDSAYEKETIKKIQLGTPNDSYTSFISKEAKDFLKRLLKKEGRLTASAAALHPWLLHKEEVLGQNSTGSDDYRN
jgi:serine/threonine protein kinase